MSTRGRTEPPHRIERGDYAGSRAVIKASGTGPRGSRALTFDEARAATAALATQAVQDGRATAAVEALLATCMPPLSRAPTG